MAVAQPLHQSIPFQQSAVGPSFELAARDKARGQAQHRNGRPAIRFGAELLDKCLDGDPRPKTHLGLSVIQHVLLGFGQTAAFAAEKPAIDTAGTPKIGFGVGGAAQHRQAGIDLVDQDLETFDQPFLRVFASDFQLGSTHEKASIRDQSAETLHQFLFAPRILITLFRNDTITTGLGVTAGDLTGKFHGLEPEDEIAREAHITSQQNNHLIACHAVRTNHIRRVGIVAEG